MDHFWCLCKEILLFLGRSFHSGINILLLILSVELLWKCFRVVPAILSEISTLPASHYKVILFVVSNRLTFFLHFLILWNSTNCTRLSTNILSGIGFCWIMRRIEKIVLETSRKGDMSTHKEMYWFWLNELKSDCIYHFPIDLKPNGIQFGRNAIRYWLNKPESGHDFPACRQRCSVWYAASGRWGWLSGRYS